MSTEEKMNLAKKALGEFNAADGSTPKRIGQTLTDGW